ncbi:MAG: ABC transporter permease, partial [Chloroflexota bacterium]
MNGIWIVFRREMGQYFATPYAYLIAAAFLLLTGFFFTDDLTRSLTLRPADPAAVPNFLAFGMVFFAPLLTMRMLAEESREGTMELLLTAPVSDSAIVIGKFLSAWAFYTLLLLVTLGYQVILVQLDVRPDLGKAVAAYVGIWLYGGATLSVGLAFSALTDSQIVAGFLSTAVLLLMWLGDNIGNLVADIELAELIRTLTLQGHYSTSFAAGIFRA